MGQATIIDLAAHRRLHAAARLEAGADDAGALETGLKRWPRRLQRTLQNPNDFMAATRHGYAIGYRDPVASALHKFAVGDELAGRIAGELVVNLDAITGFRGLDPVPYLRLLQEHVTANRLWFLYERVCSSDLIRLAAWPEAVFWGLIDEAELELASRIGSIQAQPLVEELREINPLFGVVDPAALVQLSPPRRLKAPVIRDLPAD
jgi:hypothetical protein